MISQANKSIKIAVVGDVHYQWEWEDNLTLEKLGVDLVLFVGDFGNEAIEIVKIIAELKIPKAAILGNHDAWYSASSWGIKKCPYDRSLEDRVQQQLDLLKDAHVGYGKLDFPNLNLSVVGSRPFSWGGGEWKNPEFYRDHYGINNFQESTAEIVKAAKNTLCDQIIFLGHNGPKGLGSKPHDICGKDWQPMGGDHGDIDFTEAINKTRQEGKQISLVTFGHMHHRLRYTNDRLRQIVNQDDYGTVYLNAASVPRIVELEAQKLRNFSLVSLDNGIVSNIDLLWLNSQFQIVSRENLFNYEILIDCDLENMIYS